MPQPDIQLSPLIGGPKLASRGRAIGKSSLYLLVAFVAALAVSAILKAITGKTLQTLMQSSPVDGLLAHLGLLIALVIVPTALSLLVWKEPFAFSGWSPITGGRLAAFGIATGAGLMALVVLTLWVSGAWRAAPASIPPAQAATLFATAVLLWIVQAAHEEGLHRGYAFVQLSRALSFWPAAAVLSLWFVWGHTGQAGATPVSLAVAGLFAMALAWSFLRTGSLWFALGVHASWNFVQSTLLGLANSGGESRNAFIQSHLTGPDLLTGGSAGPEGSLLSLVAIAALVLIIQFVLPTTHRS